MHKLIVIAEFELPASAIAWLRENTEATNEQETSDYVLSLSRSALEELEILEDDADAWDAEAVPLEVEKFIEAVRELPENVYEVRVR